MIHCWGFDPGLVSGWCHISVFDGEIGVFNSGEVNHNGIGNLLYDNPAIKTIVCKPEIETIFIVEKFIMNSKITQSPWSLETTGLIRYFSDYYHVPLHFQSPSQAKNLIKNDVIQRAGIYVPGRPHAMDAVRHCLYYLIVKKKVLQECLKKP